MGYNYVKAKSSIRKRVPERKTEQPNQSNWYDEFEDFDPVVPTTTSVVRRGDFTGITLRRHNRPAPSRAAEQYPQHQPLKQKKERFRLHWLLIVGMTMSVCVLSWWGVMSFVSWWQIHQDDQYYGHPRTFQTDAVVGYDGDTVSNPTHFIAFNLDRSVLIYEIPKHDAPRTKIYTGPILTGMGTDLAPVTLEFRDVSGNGRPDMILHIHLQGSEQTVVFMNDGNNGFRPVRSGDHVHI